MAKHVLVRFVVWATVLVATARLLSDLSGAVAMVGFTVVPLLLAEFLIVRPIMRKIEG